MFSIGCMVITKTSSDAPNDWANPGDRRFGSVGQIVKHSDSHGLCYKVEYVEGGEGWFDPCELQLLY